MIALELHLDSSQLAQFRRMAVMFPRQANYAMGRVAFNLRSKMRAAMRRGGGTADVPAFAPHHPLTNLLRKPHKLGGVLAESNRIVMFRRGSTQVIGWPDSLSQWGEWFQTAEDRPTTALERRIQHQRTPAGTPIPKAYSRPARPVVDPLVDRNKQHFGRWMLEELTKQIDKELAKQK